MDFYKTYNILYRNSDKTPDIVEADNINIEHNNKIKRLKIDAIKKTEQARRDYEQKKDRIKKQKELKRLSSIQRTINKLSSPSNYHHDNNWWLVIPITHKT